MNVRDVLSALSTVPRGFRSKRRREQAALRATFKRVETRLSPEDVARLEALCVRPEGCWRPSRACMVDYVISLGLDRAESIRAAALKSRAAHEAKLAAKEAKLAAKGGAK